MIELSELSDLGTCPTDPLGAGVWMGELTIIAQTRLGDSKPTMTSNFYLNLIKPKNQKVF